MPNQTNLAQQANSSPDAAYGSNAESGSSGAAAGYDAQGVTGAAGARGAAAEKAGHTHRMDQGAGAPLRDTKDAAGKAGSIARNDSTVLSPQPGSPTASSTTDYTALFDALLSDEQAPSAAETPTTIYCGAIGRAPASVQADGQATFDAYGKGGSGGAKAEAAALRASGRQSMDGFDVHDGAQGEADGNGGYISADTADDAVITAATGAGSGADKNGGASASAASDGPLYHVRYNGRDVALSLDELKTNAQKGLNYDHIKAENEQLRNLPAIAYLTQEAAEQHMSLQDYSAQLLREKQRVQLDTLVKQGMPRAQAKRYLALMEEKQAADRQRATRRPYEAFVDAYPDVRPEDIPSQVWQRFRTHGDLVRAYAQYENEQLRGQLLTLRQNSENAARRVGSVAGDAHTPQRDAFLEGLLG